MRCAVRGMLLSICSCLPDLVKIQKFSCWVWDKAHKKNWMHCMECTNSLKNSNHALLFLLLDAWIGLFSLFIFSDPFFPLSIPPPAHRHCWNLILQWELLSLLLLPFFSSMVSHFMMKNGVRYAGAGIYGVRGINRCTKIVLGFLLLILIVRMLLIFSN